MTTQHRHPGPVPRSARCIVLVIFAVLLLHDNLACTVIFAASANPTPQNNFDGAVWRFSIENRSGKAQRYRGTYRISNGRVFQKETPSDDAMSKRVGMNYPKDRKTRTVLKDFRVFPHSEPASPGNELRITGVAYLSMDRPGEWSGRFVDSQGRHWKWRCSRVQE
ncbi:MAG: hypothetical protein R3C20_18290 [Planctomycetaceae bacterium]